MARRNNRSRERRRLAPVFNSDFWEVSLDPAVSEELPQERRLWYESPPEAEERLRSREELSGLVREVRAIIESALTERQRDVVERYFFEEATEEEIAAELGIQRQVVSQHLFGIRRNGKAVGGAIAKLRKEAKRRGLAW